MWGRLGPRFALEAGFLILLAVGVALADLDWVAIVAIMAGGWLLVSLIEVIAARRPPWVPLPVERAQAAESAPPPEPPPLPEPPVLEETQEVDAPAEPRRRRCIPWRRRRDGAETAADAEAEGEDEAAVAVAADESGERTEGRGS